MASDLEILNEIDLAWLIRAEVAPGQKWLALTGTNGKTTTVEMTAKILQTAGLKAVACGNVGDTVIEAVDRPEPYEYLVLELSSFQLHWAKQAEFVSSAILNIADDHLDWHGTFDAYADAKFSILDRSAIAVLNADDGEVVKRSNKFTDSGLTESGALSSAILTVPPRACNERATAEPVTPAPKTRKRLLAKLIGMYYLTTHCA